MGRIYTQLMHRLRLNFDEQAADDLPLFLWIDFTFERLKKIFGGVLNPDSIGQSQLRQIDPKLVGLALSHQAGIDIESQHPLFRQRHAAKRESNRRVDSAANQEKDRFTGCGSLNSFA